MSNLMSQVSLFSQIISNLDTDPLRNWLNLSRNIYRGFFFMIKKKFHFCIIFVGWQPLKIIKLQ